VSEIIKRECRFAIHMPSKHPDMDDVHLIKEVLHYSDGTIRPNVKFVKNYKRDFYVTLPNKRTYKQKREVEKLENLRKVTCTQSKLRDEVAKALDRSWSNDQMNKLSKSPYIYGVDISSTSLIKQSYQNKYPNLLTPYNLAVLDIETDVINGTDEILMITLTTSSDIYTSVVNKFVSGFNSPIDLINKGMSKYIPEHITDKRIHIDIADSSSDAIKYIFKNIHKDSPDWVAIWNIDFDLPKIISALEKSGIKPKDIFNDPKVPDAYRYFRYKKGKDKKITSSGKVTPINPASRWHKTYNPAGYHFIDAMCVYKQLRLAKQEEPSYALDAILNKELGIRKLRFEECDMYSGLKWHQIMQSKYKIEYIVYNIFDCLSILELDNKTKDLSFTLPIFAGITDFNEFNSQPKKISDSLHSFVLKRGLVLGSGGFEENTDEKDILSLKDWIVTLPSHMSSLGQKLIKEDPNLRTGIRTHTADSDSVSAYPSIIAALNVSKLTTKRELITIKGISENVFKMQNLNLIQGQTNSLEYCTNMFNFKKPQDLLDEFISPF